MGSVADALGLIKRGTEEILLEDALKKMRGWASISDGPYLASREL